MKLKQLFKNESGFSLLELSIAVALMAILMVTGILLSMGNAMETTYKTTMKSDLTAVATELSGWNLNNTAAPTPQEFSIIKNRVLGEYLTVTDSAQLQANTTYVDGISFVKNNGFYCVDGTRVFSNKTYTMHFDTATSTFSSGTCPLV